MGFMDMFRTNQPNTPAQSTQPQGQNPQGSAGTPTVPTTPPVANGQMPGSQQVPVNPMDAYAKLWENTPTNTETAPSFNLDSKVLGEVAASQNFTQGISPELMTKATQGDAAAMVQVMNAVGQQAYQAALSHSSTLTDRFVAARSAHDLKGIGGKVKSELTNSVLAADSPNYNHPVVKAEFSRIANQFQSQNPDASPQQIAQATKEYMQNLHNAMNPSSASATANSQPEAQDWEKFMLS